jgi:putative endonuclease
VATDQQRSGNAAEQRAAEHLEKSGFEILARNFRCRLGELDIVARRGRLLIVAEVRLRTDSRFGGAAASITRTKQNRVVRATRYLMASNPRFATMKVRFDTLLLDATDGAIEWIEAAFD